MDLTLTMCLYELEVWVLVMRRTMIRSIVNRKASPTLRKRRRAKTSLPHKSLAARVLERQNLKRGC